MARVLTVLLVIACLASVYIGLAFVFDLAGVDVPQFPAWLIGLTLLVFFGLLFSRRGG